MRPKKRMIWCALIAYSLAACASHGQVSTQPKAAESCRAFVQDFYSWYVPKTRFDELKKTKGPAIDIALQYRGSAFSPALVRQIASSEAESKRDGEIFLDSDPILNSQDPAERYVVGNTMLKAGTCWVEISGVFSGKKRERPDVVAELSSKDGRWFFANFHYPGDGPGSHDFLSLLRHHR